MHVQCGFETRGFGYPGILEGGTPHRSLRLRLYEDPTAGLDVDADGVPVQQRHPDEGRRT